MTVGIIIDVEKEGPVLEICRGPDPVELRDLKWNDGITIAGPNRTYAPASVARSAPGVGADGYLLPVQPDRSGPVSVLRHAGAIDERARSALAIDETRLLYRMGPACKGQINGQPIRFSDCDCDGL